MISDDDLVPELGRSGYQRNAVECWKGNEQTFVQDYVAEEVPISLIYNGIPYVVMLATPLDIEDFVYGFSLTENIVDTVNDIQSVTVLHRQEGVEARIRIQPEKAAELQGQARNISGRSGCGLCGTRTLEQAIRTPPPVGEGIHLQATELIQSLEAIGGLQQLNRMTGAVHAAAWGLPGRGIQVVREDIGRHNALDKLIGALARSQEAISLGFLLITSRASYEMVQKAAMSGITCMAAISAPTALAIRLADEAGVTLIGFTRHDKHVVYAHPQRLIHSQEKTTS